MPSSARVAGRGWLRSSRCRCSGRSRSRWRRARVATPAFPSWWASRTRRRPRPFARSRRPSGLGWTPCQASSCPPSAERPLPVKPVYLPIFPLPDLTFFPHTLLPLHIFEARYRAMIMDCLARDKRMAVVGLKPGYESTYDAKPAVYQIAGVGRIVQCERLATGRVNILLKGETRVRTDRELPADMLS